MDSFLPRRARGRGGFLRAVERYFYHYRKTRLPLSLRVLCLLHLLESLQLLSLVFPADASIGLPWHYATLSWFFTVLSFVSRPDFIAARLGLAPDITLLVVALTIFVKAASTVGIAVALALMQRRQFDGWVLSPDKKLAVKLALLFDFVLNVVVFRGLSIPILVLLLGRVASGQSDAIALGSGLTLLCYVLQKAVEVAYVGTTSWFSNDFDAFSSPHAQTQMWLTSLAFCSVTVTMSYRNSSMQFALLLCAIGGFKVMKVVWTAPYHHKARNIFELAKGLIMGWSGLVLALALLNNAGQDSILATFLLMLPFPMLVALLAHVMYKHIRETAMLSLPSHQFQVEHILREHIAHTDSATEQVDAAFSRACELFPKSSQLLIWALYYYRHLKDVCFVQVNISRLMKVPWGVLAYMECYHCCRTMETWLRSIPEQAEAISFWHYQESLLEVQRKDFLVTKSHSELFFELSSDEPRHGRVMHLARSLASESLDYDYLVQSAIKEHPICPELLSIYSSFLSLLTNMKQATKYKGLSRRVSDILKANRSDNSVDLFDACCMVVATSLEPPTMGTVFWAKNTEILGYDLNEIIGSDHSVVIPEPLKHVHSHMLARISRFRHRHPVYESRHHLYFLHKSGFLIPAHWKVRLVNLPVSGELCILAALKQRADDSLVAFVDSEGASVTAMTEGFFEKMRELRRRAIPSNFRLTEVFGEGWTEGKVVCCKEGRSREMMWLVKCEFVQIFEIYPQKALKIYYEWVDPTLMRPTKTPSTELMSGLLEERTNSKVLTTTAEHLDTRSSSVIAGKQILASFHSRGLDKRRSTFFASLFESGVPSLVADTDKPESQKDMWKEVSRIVKRRKTAVTGAVRWLDLAVAITMSVSLVALMSFFFIFDVNDYADMLQEFLNLNQRSELAISASLRARELLDQQRFPAPDLLSVTEALKSRIGEAQDNSNSAFRRASLDTTGLWLEYDGSNFRSSELNSLELLRSLTSHLNQLTTPAITKEFVTVYRNGAAETLIAMNRTIQAVIASTEAAAQSQERLFPMTVSFCIVAVVCVLSLTSVAVLRRTDRARRDLWRVLRSLPRPAFLASRVASRERLETLHLAGFLQADEANASFRVQTRAASAYRTLFELKSVSVTLLLLICALIGILIVTYNSNVRHYEYFQKQVPTILSSAGLRKVSLLQTQFYLRELLYADSFFVLCTDFQPIFDLREELLRSLLRLKHFERRLSFPDDESEKPSSRLKDVLFSAYPDAAETHLRYGLHNAVTMLMVDVLACLDEPTWDLEGLFAEVLQASEQVSKSYKEEAENALVRGSETLVGATAAMAITMIVVYGLFIRRLVLRVIRLTTEEWRVLIFLSKDSAAAVFKLLKR